MAPAVRSFPPSSILHPPSSYEFCRSPISRQQLRPGRHPCRAPARPRRALRLAQGKFPQRRRRRHRARRFQLRRLPPMRRDCAVQPRDAGGEAIRRQRRAGAGRVQRVPGARPRPACCPARSSATATCNFTASTSFSSPPRPIRRSPTRFRLAKSSASPSPTVKVATLPTRKHWRSSRQTTKSFGSIATQPET